MSKELDKAIDNFFNDFNKLHKTIQQFIVGQDEVVNGVLTVLFAGGHVLLEGVPGLGKTALVNTLSQALDASFSRIQFTPDLMPSDIVGTDVIVEEEGRKRFTFRKGPVFANIVLADEVNRATPKTQSALLEAMQEHSVTVTGTTHLLPEPFMVLATQNPLEMEGTYPLPEAQLDRFMFKVLVPFPSREDLHLIMNRTTGAEKPEVKAVLSGSRVEEMKALVRTVPVPEPVQDYALRILEATHPETKGVPKKIRKYVRYGASPRGAQAMLLTARVSALAAGRPAVTFEDVRKSAKPALRHRIILNFEGEAEGIERDSIIDSILKNVREEG